MVEQDISAESLAAGLYATGFAPGDTAAIFIIQDSIAARVSDGVTACGGVVERLDPRLSDAALAAQLAAADILSVFVGHTLYERIKRIQPQTKLRRVVCVHVDSAENKRFWLFKRVRTENAVVDAVNLRSGDMLLRSLLKLGTKTQPPRIATRRSK